MLCRQSTGPARIRLSLSARLECEFPRAALAGLIVAAILVASAGAQTPTDRARAADLLAGELTGFRLAEPGDFVQELAQVPWVDSATESVYRSDFDQDGNEDWALLVVNENAPEYRVYYAIAVDDGHRFDLVFTRMVEGSVASSLIRNALFLKMPGDAGIANRKYATIVGHPLLPENRNAAFNRERAARTQEYTAVPAIELWTGPAQADNVDGESLPDSGIAYCSETWYYREGGELESFDVCD